MTSTKSRKGQAAAGRLAKAPAAQQLALHLHHRVPGAQGQSQGHQGLGRPDQAGRLRHHPQSQDLGRCRWNYLAAWAYAKQKGGSDDAARDYIAKLFKNVPVLDSGARGATITFVERGIGDVLLAWENEALISLKEWGPDKFDIVALGFHPGRAAGGRGGQGR
jgi:ABC-type Fe3+ transport system substrate-binding protein